jgi:hypothetical protein
MADALSQFIEQGQAQALAEYSNAYEAWLAQQLEDGVTDPDELDDEAYANALLGEWEANNDDLAWKAGC